MAETRRGISLKEGDGNSDRQEHKAMGIKLPTGRKGLIAHVGSCTRRVAIKTLNTVTEVAQRVRQQQRHATEQERK